MPTASGDPTELEDLISARARLAAALAAFSLETGPDITVGGVSVNRVEHLEALGRQFWQLSKAIAILDPRCYRQSQVM